MQYQDVVLPDTIQINGVTHDWDHDVVMMDTIEDITLRQSKGIPLHTKAEAIEALDRVFDEEEAYRERYVYLKNAIGLAQSNASKETIKWYRNAARYNERTWLTFKEMYQDALVYLAPKVAELA